MKTYIILFRDNSDPYYVEAITMVTEGGLLSFYISEDDIVSFPLTNIYRVKHSRKMEIKP